MPEQFIHGVEIVEVDGGTRPIRTVKSSVIGLIGTASKGPINTPTLIIGSRAEAVAQFGAADARSSIPDALEAIFDQVGAMVVVIRVTDTEPPVTAEDVVRATGVVFDDLANTGIKTVSSVTADAGVTVYVEGTDWKLTGDQIEWISGGTAPADAATYQVDYEYYLDAATIKSNIIGGVDGGTGQYQGVHALLGAESTAHVTPRILIATGFTQEQAVLTEMVGIADKLRAIIVADGPDTNDADAITYRDLFGSSRVYLVDPWVTVWDTVTSTEVVQPVSARVAGLIAKSDNQYGFWHSPSNRELLGIVGSSRAVDYTMGDPNCRANYLNENEVTTIIHLTGYRLWGNRTTSSDPKYAFLSVRRTADMILDSILRAHLWAIDRNITTTYLETVTEGVNAYLRSLKSIGAIIGGKCWADPELNTPAKIADGQVFFDFDFTPPYPAEKLTFRSHLVNNYLEEVI